MGYQDDLQANIPIHYKKFYVSFEKLKSKIYKIVKFERNNKIKLKEKLKLLQHPEDFCIDKKNKNVSEKNIASKTSDIIECSITQQMNLWRYFPEAKFRHLMQNEIKKLNFFSNFKYHEILENLKRIAKNIQDISKCNNNAEESLKTAEKKLEFFSSEIVHLDNYISNNYKCLVRLGNIFDIWMNMHKNQWFLATLIKEKFCNLDIDKLLIILSLCWDIYRKAFENLENQNDTSLLSFSSAKWNPPEDFTRKTTKYLLKLDQVVHAKVLICRHLPYLIFGVSQKDLETLLNPYVMAGNSFVCLNKNIQDSQPISSVYFDNEDAYCYESRILRYENAVLLRIRWYGDNNGERDKELFVERKTHHEGWTGEESKKERFSIEQKDVFNFMKGKMSMHNLVLQKCKKEKLSFESKKIKTLLNLGGEIQNFIVEKKLQPMIRTSYLRSAFQKSDTNLVRISLDTNVCMVDECIKKNHPGEPWCRVAEDLLGKNEVVRFPYAILEVKLQTNQPQWVSKMLYLCKAAAVFKFSKFQHGMAFLHRDMTNYAPHWLEEFERRGYVAGFTGPHSYEGFSVSTPNITQSNLLAKLTDNSASQEDEDNISLCANADEGQLNFLQKSHHSNLSAPSSFAPETAEENFNKIKFSRLSEKFGPPSCYKSQNAIVAHEENTRTLPHKSCELQGERTKTLRLIETRFFGDQQDTQNNSRDDFLLFEEKVRARGKQINLLDPKSLFAAERTFLSYIQKALYLLVSYFVSFLFPRSQKFIAFSSLLLCIAIVIYSYYMYIRRINIIQRRKTGTPCNEKERFDSMSLSIVILISLLFFIFFSVSICFSQNL